MRGSFFLKNYDFSVKNLAQSHFFLNNSVAQRRKFCKRDSLVRLLLPEQAITPKIFDICLRKKIFRILLSYFHIFCTGFRGVWHIEIALNSKAILCIGIELRYTKLYWNGWLGVYYYSLWPLLKSFWECTKSTLRFRRMHGKKPVNIHTCADVN